MSDSRYVMLQRGILAITGEDARTFLQGLISNDIEKVGPDRAIYAALLTPQGKCLFDFFIAQHGDSLLIDVEADRATALTQRLTMYKLRAKADIADVSGDFGVGVLLGDAVLSKVGFGGEHGAALALGDGLAFVDPRLSALGARVILPKKTAASTLEALGLRAGAAPDYDRLRFSLGVPEGSGEFGVDKSPLLELGFEELNGVDFDKGCFVGQELTARMKYRALVRKRLMPVTFENGSPEPGTAIKSGSRDIGELRAKAGDGGFAVLRIDKLAEGIERGEALFADDIPVKAVKPDWVNF